MIRCVDTVLITRKDGLVAGSLERIVAIDCGHYREASLETASHGKLPV